MPSVHPFASLWPTSKFWGTSPIHFFWLPKKGREGGKGSYFKQIRREIPQLNPLRKHEMFWDLKVCKQEEMSLKKNKISIYSFHTHFQIQNCFRKILWLPENSVCMFMCTQELLFNWKQFKAELHEPAKVTLLLPHCQLSIHNWFQNQVLVTPRGRGRMSK